MPFTRPTLQELIDRSIADVETRLPSVDARLRRSNLNVLARVHAGAVHGLYGYIDFIARQIIYDLAETEYLERWASIWGITRTAAAQAVGNVTFTGDNASVIRAGTLLQRGDGAEYVTDADATIASGTATAPVTASVAGAAGNTDAGSAIALVSPITGVNSVAVVAAGGFTGGTDTEGDDSLRARLLSRIRQPPHGGAHFDYETWAREVPGVTRAWVYPMELGDGTVTVRFVRDGDESIIPDAAEVEAVQDYIDERRPVTADVTVVAPIPVEMDFTIQVEPTTQAVKDSVEAELDDLLRREGEPGATIFISHIREAISIAAGEVDHVLTSPNANVTHDTGEIPVMGVITWV